MRDSGGTEVADAKVSTALPADTRVQVASGPDRGKTAALRGDRPIVIGTAGDCDLVLTDPRVSRRHLELAIQDGVVAVRDLGSSNGSFIQGARFEQLRAGVGTSIEIGGSELVLAAPAAEPADGGGVRQFGDLVAASAPMRSLFATLERVALTDSAVLIQGETGTGKDRLAEGLHRRSRRADAPFVVCDLAMVSSGLMESELFGHTRGAFTGAERDRDGAFRAAHGGTIFLDEVGELPLEMQPRLLRVLERRQIKPMGTNTYRDVDVRVVAATNRDLPMEVRAGRFRADLYHRLAVVEVVVPPLRERRDDIPSLLEHFVQRFAAAAGGPAPRLTDDAVAALCAYDWPGNVRELRNVIERAIAVSAGAPRLGAHLFGVGAQVVSAGATVPTSVVDDEVPFKEAKDRLVQAWEREYLDGILRRAGGNVSLAARRSGLARAYLHALMRKHGLARHDDDPGDATSE